MVTVEAMLCGRIPIVTACGINPELVDDGVTGFLASAPTAQSFEDAMERAWERRNDWEQMGRTAAERVAQRYELNAIPAFAGILDSLLSSFCRLH